jgi:hypothetical protein
MPSYKLDDLAKVTGLTPCAVRYYAERGLLPRAPFRGSSTTYGEGDRIALLPGMELHVRSQRSAALDAEGEHVEAFVAEPVEDEA